MNTSIIRHIDDDGRECAGIELANAPGRRAWLYLADYLRFVQEHGFGPWYLNGVGKNLYVRTHPRPSSNRPLTVAKFIADVRPYTAVKYIDGDHCNLYRSNLWLVKWGRDESKIRPHLRATDALSGGTRSPRSLPTFK